MKDKRKFDEILLFPHYHFDLEWWKTKEEYQVVMEGVWTSAFELLEKHPEFTYCLDQGASIEPYLRKHPEKREILKKYVREGRVEVVGGTWSAPDENIPYGESLVRGFILGKQYFRREFETEVKIAWEIDEFGHPSQLPQILRKCGFDYFVFSRGVTPYNAKRPVDFWWEAPDKTRIKTHWMCCHYIGLTPLIGPLTYKAFFKELSSRLQYEGERSTSSSLFVPCGADFTIPRKSWLIFAKKWNLKERPKITFATPKSYFKKLDAEKESDIDIYRGDFNPLFTGCYTSRERVKKLCRLSQNLALQTETLCTIAALLGGLNYPQKAIEEAWASIIENNSHDSICGTGVDRVYNDTLKRYKIAIALLEKEKKAAVECVAEKIKAKKEGVPYVVFNSLGWKRRELVSLPAPDKDKAAFSVTDATGKALPVQVSDGKAYVLSELPSMGYKVLYVKEEKSKNSDTGEMPLLVDEENLTLSNKFYTVRICPDSGNIKSLRLKDGGELIESSKFAANELLVEEDAGNLWTIHTVGKAAQEKGVAKVRIKEKGRLRVIIEAEKSCHHMFVKKEMTFYAHTRRIDLLTSINFKGKDKKVKVAFPLNLNGKRYYVETPFCVEEKESGIWCAQNFVDATDGKEGLAIINSGIPGYEIRDDYLALNLFRSVSVLSLTFLKFVIKHFREIITAFRKAYKLQIKEGLPLFEMAMYGVHGIMLRQWSSYGLALSRKPSPFNILEHSLPYFLPFREAKCWERGWHHFNYSLYPHKGDFTRAELPFKGWEFNNPPEVVKIDGVGGKLPEEASLFELPSDAILLSAKKAGEGSSLVLRCYEPYGKDKKNIRVTIGNINKLGNLKAEKVSLDERSLYEKLVYDKRKVTLPLSAWEIASLKIDGLTGFNGTRE
jgi:alpha-mannosidase